MAQIGGEIGGRLDGGERPEQALRLLEGGRFGSAAGARFEVRRNGGPLIGSDLGVEILG
jgi:hypothetical protein